MLYDIVSMAFKLRAGVLAPIQSCDGSIHLVIENVGWVWLYAAKKKA